MKFLKDYVIPSITGTVVWAFAVTFTLVTLFSMTVLAEEAVAAAPPDIGPLIQALADRNWPLVAALLVTIIVWGVRFWAKDKMNLKHMKWILLGCTVLTGAAGRILQAVQDNHTWWIAMIQGILEGATLGLTSMGLWSSGGRDILPSPKRE